MNLLDQARNEIRKKHYSTRPEDAYYGKGMKDRSTMLPEQLRNPLKDQIEKVKMIHAQDIQDGGSEVYLSYALERKCPRAAKE